MTIDPWLAAAVFGAALGMACLASRWWYGRQVQALTQRLHKFEALQQNSQRMTAQARKQIDELQRMVSEYRRRLANAEVAKQRRAPLVTQVGAVAAAPAAAAAIARPGGWADTQPM